MLQTSMRITRQSTWFVAAIGCMMIVIGALLLSAQVRYVLKNPSDFTQDYVAGLALRDGRSIYTDFTLDDMSAGALRMDHQLEAVEPIQNNHPPFNMLIFVPLSFLPYGATILLWSLLSILLFLLTMWVVARELRLELASHWAILLIGLGLCWFPLQAHVGLGQLSLLLIACIVGGWALLRRQYDLVGGALIGAACLIKLFPGLLILYLLVRRRLLAGGSALATVALGGLLTLALVGVGDMIDYFVRVAPRDSEEYSTSPINIGLAGVIRRLLADGPWVSPLIHAPTLAVVLIGLASLGTLIVLLRQIRRMPPTVESHDRGFALVCLAMLLISPLTWQHVFPLLLLPFGLLLQGLRARPDRRILGLCLLALTMVSLPDIEIARALMRQYEPYRMPWFVGLLLALPTIGLILLWWAITYRSQADDPSSEVRAQS